MMPPPDASDEAARACLDAALALLRAGRLAEGWDAYEGRWQVPWLARRHRGFAQPAWAGEPTPGLLIWCEQGIGDQIFHAGLIAEAAARAASCIVECEPRLQPLFARSFPGVAVVARGDPPHPATRAPGIAHQIAAGSLARLFRRDFESFPARRSYLAADPARVEALRRRYLGAAPRPLIGIAWHTISNVAGAARSIPLELWEPVFRVPGLRFVSLQYGSWTKAIANARKAFGAEALFDPEIDQLTDLDAFAAQVAAMDRVIAIDNSALHVAGALGVPCWGLLPRPAEWRWLEARADCPWYPALRLIRQERHGEWRPVMARVAAALSYFAAPR